MDGTMLAPSCALCSAPGASCPSRKKLQYSSAKVDEGRLLRSMYSSSNSARTERFARATSESWKPMRFTRSISRKISRNAGRMRPGRGDREMLIGLRTGTGSPVSVATMKKLRGPLGSITSFSSRELRALWNRSSVSLLRRPSVLDTALRGRLQSTIPCAKLSSGSVLLATSTPSVSGTRWTGRSGATGSRGSGSIASGAMSKSSLMVDSTLLPSKSPTATTAILAGW
mmetsp:Transcript_29208/g.77664  ORF Transcript_29208/g.77664 Transcript_29208/m.77664 type:complete len:228 (-) Transcript_29208:155-838(-)